MSDYSQGSKHEQFTGSAASTITVLTGWSFRENAGSPAAAKINIRKTNGSGAIVATIALAASGDSQRDYAVPVNIGGDPSSSTNLYVEVVSGTVVGSVFGF